MVCFVLRQTLTGGADKKARLFDLTAGKVLATLEGHTKKVTDVIVHPAEDMLFTASADKTVRIWTPAEEGAYQAAHVIAGHSGDVNSISLQPTGKFIASGGADANWCFIDAVRGAVLKTFSDAAIQHGTSCLTDTVLTALAISGKQRDMGLLHQSHLGLCWCREHCSSRSACLTGFVDGLRVFLCLGCHSLQLHRVPSGRYAARVRQRRQHLAHLGRAWPEGRGQLRRSRGTRH